MSATVPRKIATYEDLLEVPDHFVAEIINGELYATPRPALRHANTSTTLGGDLTTRFHRPGGGRENPGGWWILDEPELHLHQDVIVPDIAGWRRERMPSLPDAPWLEVAPDWVCEVISPRTESIDRGRKLRIYARERVTNLWLANPIAKTLEVYRLSETNWTLLRTYVNDEVVEAEPFATVPLDMSRWWLPDAPTK